MPNEISYDPEGLRLRVGTGWIENVPKAVWDYEVSGKQVISQWFNQRRRDREKPPMGDRRPASPLSELQPNHWLPEYTSELLILINILGYLIDLEPKQARLLERVCSGPLISLAEMNDAGALEVAPVNVGRRTDDSAQAELFPA